MANVASIWYILLEEHREYVRKEGIDSCLEDQYVPSERNVAVEEDVIEEVAHVERDASIEGYVPFKEDVPVIEDVPVEDVAVEDVLDEEDEEVTRIRGGRCRPVDKMPVRMEVEDNASTEEDIEDLEVKKYETSMDYIEELEELLQQMNEEILELEKLVLRCIDALQGERKFLAELYDLENTTWSSVFQKIFYVCVAAYMGLLFYLLATTD